MNTKIQELIDRTRKTFGLAQYHLKRKGFYRSINMFNETVYRFNMEWFPPHQTEPCDDDTNPEGTAVIEVNLNTGQFESAIFVMGKTYARNGVTFNSQNPNDIIPWVEQVTALTYGDHFQLHKKEEGELLFGEGIDGYSVTPSGTIEVKWNQDGQLIYFVQHGPFLAKQKFKHEEYTLSIEMVEHIAKQQVKRFEWPSFEQQKMRSIYAVEEIYIKNDGKETIPYGGRDKGRLKVNQIIEWNEPINESFVRKELDMHEEVSAEQAFSLEPSPDTIPISEKEKYECVKAVRIFLQKEYPQDTRKWLLDTLYREHGYIHAILKTTDEDSGSQDKMLVFIDANTFEVLNYIDKKQMFNEFQKPKNITVSKEQAFHQMKENLKLTPIYVYDFSQEQYVLCGKLDGHDAVDAATGEMFPLEDL
ncbi:hypothetical protein [Bacillus sp. 179-C3.3 HS]|uniref:hypothetical protein n=1 Tax=Bacillus sp. 179-C3.3 HS TaxID=3232162 RepID=UPI0039A2C29E